MTEIYLGFFVSGQSITIYYSGKKRLKNWAFNRITIMDRLILRMSLSEMLYEEEVPPKVSIKEGVEIAKEFSTTDSSSFINGILDAVYNDQLNDKEKII